MKHCKRLVVYLLCFTLLLSMTSCGVLECPPDRSNYEKYWVETYDEAMYIIEQLEAYGNEISDRLISSYENETVDAKYYFGVHNEKSTSFWDILGINKNKKHNQGEEWYQCKYERVGLRYYAFLDDVSSEELIHSNYRSFRCFNLYMMMTTDKYSYYEMSNGLVFECENDGVDSSIDYDDCTCRLINAETGVLVAGLNYYNFTNHYDELPENFHEEFLKSLVVVGGK